jgi:hypothetical protein
MLSVANNLNMLSVTNKLIMLSVIMLSVTIPSIIMLIVIMLSVNMLSFVMAECRNAECLLGPFVTYEENEFGGGILFVWSFSYKDKFLLTMFLESSIFKSTFKTFMKRQLNISVKFAIKILVQKHT